MNDNHQLTAASNSQESEEEISVMHHWDTNEFFVYRSSAVSQRIMN